MTTHHPLPHHASTVWVVVADDSSARVYVRVPGSHVVTRDGQPEEILGWELSPLSDFDQTAKKNGHLIRDVCSQLNRAKAEGRFEGIVVVAPPAWLGQLRPHLSHAVHDSLIAGVAKDYTHLPLPALTERLQELFPARAA
jgi:hypothetical protein